jgi:hypothetical protein
MDDVVKMLAFVGGLIGLGVGTYAGVTVVSILKRRFGGPSEGPAPDELESIHARLASVETLEARISELEERVDFSERLIASQQRDSERLPAAPRLDHR